MKDQHIMNQNINRKKSTTQHKRKSCLKQGLDRSRYEGVKIMLRKRPPQKNRIALEYRDKKRSGKVKAI